MASAAEQLASNLNWGAIGKATELKKRLWFTIGALVVFRIGAYIPVPGVDPVALAEIFHRNAGGIAGMLDVFSGGSIGRMSILALSINSCGMLRKNWRSTTRLNALIMTGRISDA